MACDVIHTWTFCSLVGAFLDLVLAYLVLCGAAAAYFMAKFLGIFGLSLPCPCNGFFGDPSSENECRCVQRVLIEFPARRISSVQMSVQRRFPFDKVWLKGSTQPSVKLLGDGQIHDGFTEIHSVDGCSSVVDSICSFSEVQRADKLDRNEQQSSSTQDVGMLALQHQNGGKLEPKGKAICYHKSRAGLRQRRKIVFDCGRTRSATSQVHLTPSGNEFSTCNSEHEQESSSETFPRRHSWEGRVEHLVEPTHGELIEQAFYDTGSKGVAMDGVPTWGGKLGGNEPIAIQDLEDVLAEQYAVTSALYLELEKERSSAASAADEAMAMISRLQEEKAAMEMEARQYQRMIEEKAAYDAEEMNILKEILVRREREKLVLEKEVESYREMLVNGKTCLLEEEGEYDRQQMSNQDPDFLIQDINASNMKKNMSKDFGSIPETDFGAFLKAESDFKQIIENTRNESFTRLMDVCGSSNQSLPFNESQLCRLESDDIQSPAAIGTMKKIETHDEHILISAGRLMDVCGSPNQLSSPASNNDGRCGIKNYTKQPQSAEASAEKNDAHGSPNRASSLYWADSHSKESQTGSATEIDMQCEEKTVLLAADINSEAIPHALQDSILLNQFSHSSENMQQSPSSLRSGSKRKENKGVNVTSDGMLEKDQSSYAKKKDKNTWYGSDQLRNHVDTVNNHAIDSKNYRIEPDSGIYDVHVVDDNIQLGNAGRGQKSGILSAKVTVRNSLPFEASSSDPSSSSKYQEGLSIIRRSSDIDREIHAWDHLLCDKAQSFGLRRHSVPLVDSEKLQLNNEVEWLTESLRTVQEGRERLNTSTDHKENERIHLQLLEEIAQQLRGIRQLTETGKGTHHRSLPLPSSKASSKKRRCRSTSLGVNESA